MIILQLLMLTSKCTSYCDCTIRVHHFFSDCQQPPPAGDVAATRPELLERSEYSYFSQAAVEAWAGPQHWRLRPRSKPQGT